MSDQAFAKSCDDAFENLKCPSCNIPYRDTVDQIKGLLICMNCGGAAFKGPIHVTAEQLKRRP